MVYLHFGVLFKLHTLFRCPMEVHCSLRLPLPLFGSATSLPPRREGFARPAATRRGEERVWIVRADNLLYGRGWQISWSSATACLHWYLCSSCGSGRTRPELPYQFVKSNGVPSDQKKTLSAFGMTNTSSGSRSQAPIHTLAVGSLMNVSYAH